ncbi:MAG: hypothetical protein AB1744_05695, partial [Candidatus Zixiibacteriota bacterium]
MYPTNQQLPGNREERRNCINCGHTLVKKNGVWLCRSCNPEDFEGPTPFTIDNDADDYLFIECPGATLYEPGSNEVAAGVKWLDPDDPSAGYEI